MATDTLRSRPILSHDLSPSGGWNRLSNYTLEKIAMAAARAQRLERKNVIVDAGKVRRLRRTLRTSSESAAIRIAVERTLALEEAVAALQRMRRRGTWGKRIAS